MGARRITGADRRECTDRELAIVDHNRANLRIEPPAVPRADARGIACINQEVATVKNKAADKGRAFRRTRMDRNPRMTEEWKDMRRNFVIYLAYLLLVLVLN
jgi:hypothetical protein